MYKIVEAVYKNGNLVLGDKLESGKEGQKYRVIIMDNDKEARQKHFFEFLSKHSFRLPADYRFNRDELYER